MSRNPYTRDIVRREEFTDDDGTATIDLWFDCGHGSQRSADTVKPTTRRMPCETCRALGRKR